VKYLRNRENFNNDDKLEEKWYHNLLAGLMLFNPTISSAMAQSLQSIDNQNKIELSSQEEDVLEDIDTIIDYVKNNKREFKNSERIVSQLEKLLDKYEKGDIDKESMDKIAKQFVEKAKDMKTPILRTKSSEIKQDKKWGSYEKINTISSFDTLITEESPSVAYINIYENSFFESGAYNINDSKLANQVNDTLSTFSEKGYKLEVAVIESSTDGQGLSQRLKKNLEDNGYDGSNEGLSEIRNDKMKEVLVKNSNVNENLISQNIKYSDSDKINENLRYNRVVLKMVKKEASKKVEVKENVVNVYYNIIDYKKKHRIDINLPKLDINFKIKKKHKGNKKVKLPKNRYENCFFISN